MAFQEMIYPLDITGRSEANRVTTTHTITKVQGDTLFSFSFRQGVVFEKMTVVHVDTGRELRFGVDYRIDDIIAPLSRRLTQNVGCTFTLLNKKLSGTLELTVQVLGGFWSAVNPKWIDNAANTKSPQRVIDFSELEGLPTGFSVDTHVTDAIDISHGMDDLVDTVEKIYQAILKLAPDQVINIDDVSNLKELLDYKVDYRNNNKVALCTENTKAVSGEVYRRSIVLPMPRGLEERHVTIGGILTTHARTYKFSVSGDIKRNRNDYTLWDNASVLCIGDSTHERQVEIRPIYINGQPAIAIELHGKMVAGVTYTLSVLNYTTDSERPDVERLEDFVIMGLGRSIVNLTRVAEIYDDSIKLNGKSIYGNIYDPRIVSISDINKLVFDRVQVIGLPSSVSSNDLIKNNYPWWGSEVSHVLIYPVNSTDHHQTVFYKDGRQFSRNKVTDRFIEDVRDHSFFDLKRAFTLFVKGDANKFYPVSFYHDLQKTSLEGVLTSRAMDMDILIYHPGSLSNVKQRGDATVSNLRGTFETTTNIVPDNSRTVVDLFAANNVHDVAGAFALTSNALGCGGVVLYVRGGCVVQGFVNSSTAPVVDTNVLGITLPAAVSGLPSNIPKTKKLIEFKDAGRYHSLEHEFKINTGGVVILLQRGNPELEKYTIYPWATETPPKGYTTLKGGAIAAKYTNLRKLFGTHLLDMRDWSLIGKPDGQAMFAKTMGENKSHNHSGKVGDKGSVGVRTNGSGRIANQGSSFAEAYNDFTGLYGSKFVGRGSPGSHGGWDRDNFKMALTEAIGDHSHYLTIPAHGHTLTIYNNGGNRVKPSGIYTNFIIKLS